MVLGSVPISKCTPVRAELSVLKSVSGYGREYSVMVAWCHYGKGGSTISVLSSKCHFEMEEIPPQLHQLPPQRLHGGNIIYYNDIICARRCANFITVLPRRCIGWEIVWSESPTHHPKILYASVFIFLGRNRILPQWQHRREEVRIL